MSILAMPSTRTTFKQSFTKLCERGNVSTNHPACRSAAELADEWGFKSAHTLASFFGNCESRSVEHPSPTLRHRSGTYYPYNEARRWWKATGETLAHEMGYIK